ncbi:MAG: hypothetical protein EHM70_10400 [Chloroflexota bacterium]|nr:MAG: hypothetical protein EHM70_10400 [Chloroflexota bacterium]
MTALSHFIFFGALGWCAEIVWTALKKRLTGQTRSWLFMGETSLWSFPLYGLIAILYEPIHDLIRPLVFPVRGAIYLLGFWAIEYLGGWLVWKISGEKPWDYSSAPGGSLNGLIRWNFALVWPLVGLGLEPIHDLLNRLAVI